jgi:hypothetical protein
MPGINKQKDTANTQNVLPPELLAEITRNNDAVLNAAIRKANELIELCGEKVTPDAATLPGKAAAFLSTVRSLTLTIQRGNRNEAIQAAICLGLSAPPFLATSPGKTTKGKTLFEVLDAFGGHATGGQNSAALSDESDWQTLREALAKYRSGERPNFKQVASELFRQGIKGRKGKPLSTRTISRLYAELKQRDSSS